MLAGRMLMASNSGAVSIVSAYIGNEGKAGSGTGWTFDNSGAHWSIGSAAGDRYVVAVIFGGTGAGTVSSATIGGVAATIIAQTATANMLGAIIIANVPSGTTADVVVTFSASQSRAGCGVYTITGLSSAAATDSDATTTNNATLTLSTVAGGVIIAVCGSNNGSATDTWTTAVEDFGFGFDSNNARISGARVDGTSGANTGVSCSLSAGAQTITVAASWGS